MISIVSECGGIGKTRTVSWRSARSGTEIVEGLEERTDDFAGATSCGIDERNIGGSTYAEESYSISLGSEGRDWRNEPCGIVQSTAMAIFCPGVTFCTLDAG